MDRVVVLGAGYAGAGAIKSLEAELDQDDVDLLWISDTDHHLVLHEAHRAIRDPAVEHSVTIPVEDIKGDRTTFRQGTVIGLDTDDGVVRLADDNAIDYDYVVVAIGSDTAYYGIPGVEKHALTMNSFSDAIQIHEAIKHAGESALETDPAEVVVGGAGLSGIQIAGEIAAYRDRSGAPLTVTLVEALPEIYPPGGTALRERLSRELRAADIEIQTGDPITGADDETITYDDRGEVDYDVFVWTGGITGRDAMEEVGIDTDHGRLHADETFQTSDDRVFALGDAAVVAQAEDPAPPTAQAAWDAATLVGENVRRAMAGEELQPWSYESKGTLISIGETAIAADIPGAPVHVFDSVPATILKKGAAARWIASVTSWRRALRAWPDL